MFDELDKLVTVSLDAAEDFNSPVELPPSRNVKQCEHGFVAEMTVRTAIHRKRACFMLTRNKMRMRTVVLLKTDTRLIIVYTKTCHGFVLDLATAKSFKLERKHGKTSKRVVHLKIKWNFGSVHFRLPEVQITDWENFILDSFDRISSKFKKSAVPAYSISKEIKRRGRVPNCIPPGESTDDLSRTASLCSRATRSSSASSRHCPLLNELPTMNERLKKDWREDYKAAIRADELFSKPIAVQQMRDSSKTQTNPLVADASRSHSSTMTSTPGIPTLFELSTQTGKSQGNEEAAAELPTAKSSSYETSKEFIPTPKSEISESEPFEDGSALSATSWTGSLKGYEADTSVARGSMTQSADSDAITYNMPPPYSRPDESSHTEPLLYPSLPKQDTVTVPRLPPVAEESSGSVDSELSDDGWVISVPAVRHVKSIIARWPLHGNRESSA